MTKVDRERAIKNLELVKTILELSDDQVRKTFGISKKQGIENVLNAVVNDLK